MLPLLTPLSGIKIKILLLHFQVKIQFVSTALCLISSSSPRQLQIIQILGGYHNTKKYTNSCLSQFLQPFHSFHRNTWVQGRHVSLQRPVLSLQHEDLGDEHLWIHHLRKHVHGRVHQVGTEDGEELLPDELSLPPARTGLRPLLGFPLRVLMITERIGPVHFPPAVADSDVLELCRQTVCGHAARIGAVAGVMRRTVGARIRDVAHGRPHAVMMVVLLESQCDPLRGRTI